MTSSTASPPPGYDAATPWATPTARSMPMSPDPPPGRAPVMPPDRALGGFVRRIAVPAVPTRIAAARAATPTISSVRRPMSRALQRPADPVELLLADLAAGQPPAQHVQRLVAAPGTGQSPDGEDDQRDDAPPEGDHHGRHPQPASATVEAPHHLAYLLDSLRPTLAAGRGCPSAGGPVPNGSEDPIGVPGIDLLPSLTSPSPPGAPPRSFRSPNGETNATATRPGIVSRKPRVDEGHRSAAGEGAGVPGPDPSRDTASSGGPVRLVRDGRGRRHGWPRRRAHRAAVPPPEAARRARAPGAPASGRTPRRPRHCARPWR